MRAELVFPPQPSRQFYRVAVTRIDPDGIRKAAGGPDVVFWHWRGTVLDWISATLR